MQRTQKEIAVLKTMKPPKNFTVERIKTWLESLKAAHLLIERVDVKKKKTASTYKVH